MYPIIEEVWHLRDIDVYLLLTLIRKQFGLPEEGIRQLLAETFDAPISKEDMARFLEQPPKTKQLVHALHDKGFSPRFIQEYLSLAQSTVSYHLSTEPKNEYFNRYWNNMLHHWERAKLKSRS